jgi:amino acid permease
VENLSDKLFGVPYLVYELFVFDSSI